MHSRRKFLTQAGVLAAGTLSATALKAVEKTPVLSAPETVSLCDRWWFRTDSENVGVVRRWYGTDVSVSEWRKVKVPHTWQVDPAFVDYRGVAWYRRTFDAASDWQNFAVRIEFEAVFHRHNLGQWRIGWRACTQGLHGVHARYHPSTPLGKIERDRSARG